MNDFSSGPGYGPNFESDSERAFGAGPPSVEASRRRPPQYSDSDYWGEGAPQPGSPFFGDELSDQNDNRQGSDSPFKFALSRGSWQSRVGLLIFGMGLCTLFFFLVDSDDAGFRTVSSETPAEVTIAEVASPELPVSGEITSTSQPSQVPTADPAESSESATGAAPSQDYAANLQTLLRSRFRNKTEDNSPYINTASAELYDEAPLYGPHTAHMEGAGSYNSGNWIEGGYFPNNGAGTFRSECEVSHFSYDDPVVFPNQPEAAHLHMFIGNTHVNAFSTFDTILNSGGSTCNGGELNRTAYWVPAMFDGKGSIVVPSKVRFYYKTEFPAGIGKVVPYPDNLQLLGDNTNNVQSDVNLSTFRCNTIYNGGKASPSAGIPTCSGTNGTGEPSALEYMIFFDYCWNGDASTVGDWEANRDTNLVPPERFWHSSECPASHPKLLPALVTHIFYDIKPDEDTSTWFLSSDVNPETRKREAEPGTTAHADWFGGWNKEVNQEWLDNCSNIQGAECAFGLLADPKHKPNPRALKIRNDWISGYSSPNARIPVAELYKEMCSVGDQPAEANGYEAAAYCRPQHSVSHK